MYLLLVMVISVHSRVVNSTHIHHDVTLVQFFLFPCTDNPTYGRKTENLHLTHANCSQITCYTTCSCLLI